jgi:hypothetical protein
VEKKRPKKLREMRWSDLGLVVACERLIAQLVEHGHYFFNVSSGGFEVLFFFGIEIKYKYFFNSVFTQDYRNA